VKRRTTRRKLRATKLARLVDAVIADARESIPAEWQYLEEDLDDIAAEVENLQRIVAALDEACIKKGWLPPLSSDGRGTSAPEHAS
jgi:hypothetical protein